MGIIERFEDIKYLVYAMIFMIVVAVTFISMGEDVLDGSVSGMQSATLPTMNVVSEKGIEYNLMFGYLSEVDGEQVADRLTILPDDRKLKMVIYRHGNTIDKVHYTVRDMESKQLIENSEVAYMELNDDHVSLELTMKNLLESSKEYLLNVTITTNNHSDINYYTKLILNNEYDIDAKLSFALDFNSATFDKSRLSSISKYLESISTNSSNLGNITDASPLAMVGWGDLDPFVESLVEPSVISVDGKTAQIALAYIIGAGNDSDDYDTYMVNETYDIKQATNGFYLLGYNRKTEQYVDGIDDLTSSGRVYIGIIPDEDIHMKTNRMDGEKKADNAGQYSYYVNNGNLWCFDRLKRDFTEVFTFSENVAEGSRERNQNHGIRIINVSNNGDCNFLVYGYMNTGLHEGNSGIMLCSYNYGDNKIEEKVFIPTRDSYEVINNKLGELTFVDGDRFYILYEDRLYSIDLVSKEYMIEADKLLDGTYAVSEDASIIAYNINGEEYKSTAVRILNIAKHKDYEIKAEAGEYVRVLGFISQDVAYGIIDKSDIGGMTDQTPVYPMYKVFVLNENNEVIKDYEQDGAYIATAKAGNMRLTLNRVEKIDDGVYREISKDQLINKDENIADSNVSVGSYTTDGRKKEVYIKTLGNVANSEELELRSKATMNFRDDSSVLLFK